MKCGLRPNAEGCDEPGYLSWYKVGLEQSEKEAEWEASLNVNLKEEYSNREEDLQGLGLTPASSRWFESIPRYLERSVSRGRNDWEFPVVSISPDGVWKLDLVVSVSTRGLVLTMIERSMIIHGGFSPSFYEVATRTYLPKVKNESAHRLPGSDPLFINTLSFHTLKGHLLF